MFHVLCVYIYKYSDRDAISFYYAKVVVMVTQRSIPVVDN
jgi:hypothetical protein